MCHHIISVKNEHVSNGQWTFHGVPHVMILVEKTLMIENWCTLKLLDGLNYESKGEDKGGRRSWVVLPNLQHFGGKKVCWSSGMGLGRLTNNSLIHTDLHKPKNKLVNV
jgi:hypothetical protein